MRLGHPAVVQPSGFDHDVVVLGAGAAGLLAAARAADCGARVLLLEKNRRAGVKILMSGGTRCNITNARGLRRLEVVTGPIDPAYDPAQSRGHRAIQQAFGSAGVFLGPALRRLDVDATIRLFEEAGVATKIEGNGKVFPVSDRAVDVLDALLARLEHSGAVLRCLSPVLAIERIEDPDSRQPGFAVRLPDATVTARRVIVAVGGCSYPGCGTTGDGHAIARELGHTIVEPRPALVPLRVAAGWVAGLKGVSLPDAVAAVHSADGTLLQQRREAILFTHFGLSGPAILDVSRAAARSGETDRLVLRLDLLPAIPRDQLDRTLQASCRRGRRPVNALLPEVVPRRLAERLAEVAAIPPDRMGPDLARDERQRLVAVLKGLSLPIRGTLGFEKAEVTSGGVALDEVDPQTLESRRVPGLHFAGEVLDLDGLIGGYNFQAAWSTGWLAGETVATRLRG
ncbi:MAG TPA: NAD(P)/FAD-dependent oxidoreductase [Isosphaeraceae bacterium]|nr:NAD(P)/FAD-dependent oxidoreductase [Isosphaeraceae bacterium]